MKLTSRIRGIYQFGRFFWLYWRRRPIPIGLLKLFVMILEDYPAERPRAGLDVLFGGAFLTRIFDLKRRRSMLVWGIRNA